MDFSYAPEDEEFRAELRAWIDANLPDFLEQGEIGPAQTDSTLRTMQRCGPIVVRLITSASIPEQIQDEPRETRARLWFQSMSGQGPNISKR